MPELFGIPEQYQTGEEGVLAKPDGSYDQVEIDHQTAPGEFLVQVVHAGNRNSENKLMVVHGGPGTGLDGGTFLSTLSVPGVALERFLDRNHVIFSQQRGNDTVEPFTQESIEAVGTPFILNDLEAIRRGPAEGCDKVGLLGKSNGAMLSLAYAVMHPDSVHSMRISSVHRAGINDLELTHGVNGTLAAFYPREYQRLRRMAGVTVDAGGRELMQAVDEQLLDPNVDIERKWQLAGMVGALQLAPTSVEPGKGFDLELIDFTDDEIGKTAKSINPRALVIAQIATHSIVLDGQLPTPDFIMANLGTISRAVDLRMSNGHFDPTTPARFAQEIDDAYGMRSRLNLIRSGHDATDTALLASLREQTAQLWMPA